MKYCTSRPVSELISHVTCIPLLYKKQRLQKLCYTEYPDTEVALDNQNLSDDHHFDGAVK